MNDEIQSLIFDKAFYDQETAIRYCKENGFKVDYMDDGANFITMGQRHSDDFDPTTLRKISITQGIDKMVGNLREQAPETPSQVRIIKDVEIFSEGVWNGNEITEADLDTLVRSFEQTKESVRPFLKLGHNEEQALLKADGLPAAGWIDNLRKVGTKLVCDFVDVPKKIAELIDLKAYRSVSSEIFHNIEINGERFSKMLAAVALLGQDTPGVMNLSDILSMYGFEVKSFNNNKKNSVIINFTEDKMPQKTALEEKLEKDLADAKKANADLTKKVETYSAKDQELADKDEKLKAQEKKIEQYKKKEAEAIEAAKKAKIEKYASELEKENLATPAMKDHVIALVGPEKDNYSIGDKKIEGRQELLKETLKLFKAAMDVNLNEGTDKGQSADDSVEETIQKYMAEHKVDYKTAFKACAKRKLEE
jgi:hypothetical protein